MPLVPGLEEKVLDLGPLSFLTLDRVHTAPATSSLGVTAGVRVPQHIFPIVADFRGAGERQGRSTFCGSHSERPRSLLHERAFCLFFFQEAVMNDYILSTIE